LLPILFRIGSIEIHSYTVCMLTAYMVTAILGYREAKRRHRLTESTLMAGSAGLLGGVLGSKLFMIVFLGPAEFWRLLPTIPFHGAALVGGLIGGYAAVTITERVLHVDRCTGDLIAPFMPLSQAIGRLGNFLAGDAYGMPTTLPWGVYQAGAVRQPVQIYEMILDLALFAFLLRKHRGSFRDGELFQMYIIGYSLIRFPLEFLRYQPTPLDFHGLTLVQWMCIASVLYFGYQYYRQHKNASVPLITASLLPKEKDNESR
jgi:phosphatidylglycerol:prolipoprotein diacylglycerol transferase